MAGVLGKLFKKEDEEDFLSYDKTMGSAGVPGPAGLSAPSSDFGMPGATLPSVGGSNQMIQKDIELITSKLDALKVSMDTLLQRLANIEARLNQLQQSQQQQAQQQPTFGQQFGFASEQQSQPQQQQQQDTGWHF